MAVVVEAGSEAELAQENQWISGKGISSSIDAWLLVVLGDGEPLQQVRQLKKMELATVWKLTRSFFLLGHSRETAPLIL
jgi:hypothetical protein